MKIQGVTNDVLTNSQKESKFTINASAQAFRILSDGLYEHKVAAIVRELSCNAYDAHKMAGREDHPFKIVLPNNLHPYFEVEDEGVGLDDEGVREVYTSYFTSTKSDSNEAIGGFGLGSKTPFAYTSSFNIRARKDNVERFYSAYIGGDGAPCVNLMSERITSEHDGVRITVPVKESDQNRFANEAEFILSFFKTKPEVTGRDSFKFTYPSVYNTLEEHGIATVGKEYCSSSLYTGSFFIVMGGVCYPLSEHYVRYSVANDYLNTVVMGNSYGNVTFIKFDIGELEVAASRENLSMDDETELVLKNKIRDFAESLRKSDQIKIEASPNAIEAIRFVKEVYGAGPIFDRMFEYRGKSLRHHINKKRLGNHKEFCFFIDDSPYRSKNKKIMRYPSGITTNRVLECEKLVGIYPNKPHEDYDDITAFKKYVREVSGKNESHTMKNMTVAFLGPVKESTKKRIEAFFGLKMEMHCIDDMREEDRLQRKKLREAMKADGPVKVKGEHTKLKDTICRGASISVDNIQKDNAHVYASFNKSERIDLSDPDRTYYRAERFESDERIVVTRRDVMNIVSVGKIIKYTASKTDKTAIIVMENKMNTKKLNDNSVENISVLFESIYSKENIDKLILLGACSKIAESRYRWGAQTHYYENMNKLVRLGAPVGGYRMDGIIEESLRDDTLPKEIFSESMIDAYGKDVITYDDFSARVDEVVEEIKEELDASYKKYPLIFVSMPDAEYLDKKEILSHLKKYVKMVDAESDSE